jgi:putative copper resistance protein D
MTDTDPLAVAVRFALYATLGLSFGFPLFWLYGVGVGARGALPLRGLLCVAALGGLIASMLGLTVLAASMSGIALAEVDPASILMVAKLPGVGTAWLVRVAALAMIVIVALWAKPTRRLAMVATTLGGSALASLAWAGHAAMSEGGLGYLHLAADIAHLFAASAWLGALVALIMLAGSSVVAATVHQAATNFAVTGSFIVGVLIVTGLINAWAIVGPDRIVAALGGTYGRLLVIKLLLFVAMLALAARHRFTLVPMLAQSGDLRPAQALLRRSIAVEATAAVAVLAIVAWLGMLDPVGAA